MKELEIIERVLGIYLDSYRKVLQCTAIYLKRTAKVLGKYWESVWKVPREYKKSTNKVPRMYLKGTGNRIERTNKWVGK